MKYIASVSWGKDSTAMIIKLITNHMPLDEIVFYDTGMEFDAIYKTRDYMIEHWLKPYNIKYTELKPYKSFIYMMISHAHTTRNGKLRLGYGWCGGLCRWGTSQKTNALNKYCKDSIVYVGIAYDEPERYMRLTPNKHAPLYDMKITESDALNICYESGIDFGGLYKYLKRVSCWCCRNKNLTELTNYKKYLPKYFEKLCFLEEIIGEPMKPPYTLKERFGELNEKEN